MSRCKTADVVIELEAELYENSTKVGVVRCYDVEKLPLKRVIKLDGRLVDEEIKVDFKFVCEREIGEGSTVGLQFYGQTSPTLVSVERIDLTKDLKEVYQVSGFDLGQILQACASLDEAARPPRGTVAATSQAMELRGQVRSQVQLGNEGN